MYTLFQRDYETQGIEGVECILGAFSVELSVVSSDNKQLFDNAYITINQFLKRP
jgi:hypothetical protein